MRYDYLIVGAGFAGSVFAERITHNSNKKVLLVEKRNHIGGNAYDECDDNGVLVHKYGPHIFHTNSKKVFEYLSQFTEWREYEHKVLAKIEDDLFPIPINRTTVNKLFNLSLKSEEEVADFFEIRKEKRNPILNSEDYVVNQVGTELYEKFFKYYTQKQWNLDPSELSPSVCGRIPIRFNTDDRYFSDEFQFMPKDGYTRLFEKMLKNPNIEILLNTDYKSIISEVQFDKMVYTGPLDYFFDYKFGKLPYRSINFEFENLSMERYQAAPVVNYVEPEPKFTRITEFKYLTGQSHKSTTICKEFPTFDGEPYYPIIDIKSRELTRKYSEEMKKYPKVIFCGRLAENKYYNMDQVVGNVLARYEK